MKKRGAALVEAIAASFFVAMMILASMSFMTTTLSSYYKTDVRVEMTDQGALTLRRISEQIRSALVVEVLSDGREIAFELPMLAQNPDPVTGEREYATPMVSDGIDRRYYVNADGELYYREGLSQPRRLMTGILLEDPDPQSLYYNRPYPIFHLVTVGTKKSLRIMVVAERETTATTERNRMSTEILLRNAQ